jgi:hypothetical protein
VKKGVKGLKEKKSKVLKEKKAKEEDGDGELNKGNMVISPFNGHSNVF